MEPSTVPAELHHNLFVMEVYNNWDYIVKLLSDYKEGKLENRKIDQLDQYWLQNITQNSLNLESFAGADDFYEKLIK